MWLTLLPVGTAALPAVGATVAIDLVVLGGIWLALRPRGADIRSVSDLERAITDEKPLLVELSSSLCLISMANRQTLREAAAALGDSARLGRVELPAAAGRVIGDTYGIVYTPSFLLFDAHGKLARRIVPDTVAPLANGYRVLDETGSVVGREPRITPELLVSLVRRAA